MSGLGDPNAIPDPFDPQRAIMPSGNMGCRVSIAFVGADPQAPRDWKDMGWIEPSSITFRYGKETL